MDFNGFMLRQGGEYHRGSEKWKKQVGRAKSERDEMNDLIEQRAKSLHIPSEKIHEVDIFTISYGPYYGLHNRQLTNF